MKNPVMTLGLMLFSAMQLSQVFAEQPTAEELEAWFNSDTDISEQVAQVNEGQLTFLPEPNNKQVYQAYNTVRILSTSIDDGWVELSQCHSQLDAVPLAQLVFPEYTLRKLSVTEKKGIETAEIEGKSVQLQDIRKGARLCVTMQIQALQLQTSGEYVLSNGPFQRRFLDGFFPLNVLLLVDYSESGLRPIMTIPESQPGMRVTDNGSQMGIDAHFEGILRTRVVFRDWDGQG